MRHAPRPRIARGLVLAALACAPRLSFSFVPRSAVFRLPQAPEPAREPAVAPVRAAAGDAKTVNVKRTPRRRRALVRRRARRLARLRRSRVRRPGENPGVVPPGGETVRPTALNVEGDAEADAEDARVLHVHVPHFFGLRKRRLREVRSVAQLRQAVDEEGINLEDLSVLTGPRSNNTTASAAGTHPVSRGVWERVRGQSKPSRREDGRKLGLAIEGGGMRGCVGAGAVSCLHWMGVADAFDVVYGASAGSLVGAFFVARQTNGTAVYHDVLPQAGSKFIDKSKLPQAIGLHLPQPFAKGGDKGPARDSEGASGQDADGDRGGGNTAETTAGSEPLGVGGGGGGGVDSGAGGAGSDVVISLDFLLKGVVDGVRPLDFPVFRANDQHQPLHVVASGLRGMGSVTLTSRKGHFSSLEELTHCIRASMLVPGLAGPLVTVPANTPVSSSSSSSSSSSPSPSSSPAGPWRGGGRPTPGGAGGTPLGTGVRAKGTWRRPGPAAGERGGGGGGEGEGDEPLVDAMLFEPLPYRSAVAEGCTHVLVLATRPEGRQVLGKKAGVYESFIARKYFEQHAGEKGAARARDHMMQLRHLRVYAEDALMLGEGSRTGRAVAVPPPSAAAGASSAVEAAAGVSAGGGGGRSGQKGEEEEEEERTAFLLAVAPPKEAKEVGQLEMDRRAVLQGCRDGFAACYDVLAVADPDGAWARHPGAGAEAARAYFPDSLLETHVDFGWEYLNPGRLIWPEPPPPLAPTRDAPPATAVAAAAAAAAVKGAGHRAGEGLQWLGGTLAGSVRRRASVGPGAGGSGGGSSGDGGGGSGGSGGSGGGGA